jgi:hypothetical protein
MRPTVWTSGSGDSLFIQAGIVSGISPDSIFQAHHQPGSEQNAQPGCSVLLLGAAGRLGEGLIAALSANQRVASVDVATVKPIEMGVARLRGLPLEQLRYADIVIAHLLDPNHPLAQSAYGRDAAFAVLDEAQLTALIPQLEALGIKKVVVVKPLSVYQQMGGLARQLMGLPEMQLYQAGFDSLTFIRPAPLVEPAAAQRSSEPFLKRLLNGYLRLNFFTLPTTFDPIRNEDLAAMIIDLALQAQPGLKVFTADQLRVKLEATKIKA